jgi:5-formyltetrahydrofolate cyclo-ligase
MNEEKQAVRERVWARMTEAGVVGFPGAKGRIPNFTGAADAARALSELDEWRAADTVKANPDMPQLPVRTRALANGKLLYLAVPRLRDARPFLLLDPDRLEVTPRAAASIKGSSVYGVPTAAEEIGHVDLIVCGTVAVNPAGVRIGKGGGYSDLEYALGCEAGIIDDTTTIVTTVHAVQVLDEDLPETDHDFRVDLIVTPDEVVRTGARRRLGRIDWSELDDDQLAAIPALAERVPRG